MNESAHTIGAKGAPRHEEAVLMYPIVPAWSPPIPFGFPVPAPVINVLGVKVIDVGSSSFVTVGPSFVSQNSSNSKDTQIHEVNGDWACAPVWWGTVADPDNADTNNWTPQGYL